jgi:hypothetical protein
VSSPLMAPLAFISLSWPSPIVRCGSRLMRNRPAKIDLDVGYTAVLDRQQFGVSEPASVGAPLVGDENPFTI